MLLYFSCKNFKSFRDGFEFRMVAEKKMKDLTYSLITKQIGGKKEEVLSSSVIYGPNAAGKSSVINAMSCMRQIILRGNIKDAEDDKAGDRVSNRMNLIPFIFQEKVVPTCFDITFEYNSIKYQYVLSFVIGQFFKRNTERYIKEEKLYVNDRLIYDRTKDEVSKLDLGSIQEYMNQGYTLDESEKIRKIMSDNMDSGSLLLMTDFNSFCSKKVVSMILKWFQDKFIIINSAENTKFLPVIIEDGQVLINVYMNNLAKEAGIVGSGFAYLKDRDQQNPKVMSILTMNGETFGLDAEAIESVGTLRMIYIMPAIIVALKRGATLAVDELDASLHPVITMNLISIFHNDRINTKGAQLIFNTQNPVYMDHDILRRDEIKYVERDKKTKTSSLYALSDFRANGEISVRSTSDYMKNYLNNRYGAIEDIDFSDIVTEILKGANDDA